MFNNEDDNLNLRESVQEELNFDEQHRRKHEEANSKLIDSYVKYQTSALKYKNYYKFAFVAVCIFMLIIPPIVLIFLMLFVICKTVAFDSYGTIVVFVGDMISFVAAVKYLPQIVAKYCFNRDENNNIQQLFLNVYQHDKDLQDKE